eukprot:6481928-Amphidinium_carterae.1
MSLQHAKPRTSLSCSRTCRSVYTRLPMLRTCDKSQDLTYAGSNALNPIPSTYLQSVWPLSRTGSVSNASTANRSHHKSAFAERRRRYKATCSSQDLGRFDTPYMQSPQILRWHNSRDFSSGSGVTYLRGFQTQKADVSAKNNQNAYERMQCIA